MRSTVRCTTGSCRSSSALFDEIHQTAVYVTHDVAEAFALGSRVAVMRAGRILQVASPEQLWAGTGRRVGGTVHRARERRGAGRNVVRDPAGGSRPSSRCRRAMRSSPRTQRDGPVVTLRARFDDGREIVSAHAGLSVPAPGTRVAVEVDQTAVIEVPTDLTRT